MAGSGNQGFGSHNMEEEEDRTENPQFGRMIQDFFLKYLGATFAVVLIIETIFSGNLRPDSSTIGRAELLSNLRYHTSVIISLFQALGTLSVSSRRLNRLSG